jgi:cell division protein FtsB
MADNSFQVSDRVWFRPVTVFLAVLLVIVHLQLWFGKYGVLRGHALKAELARVTALNQAAQQKNLQLQQELDDLRNGREMIEEKARTELGMLKPNELYIKYDPHRTSHD